MTDTRKKNKIVKMKILEVSSCFQGANPFAEVAMLKMRKSVFNAILGERQIRDKLWDYTDALNNSFRKIIEDEEIKDKKEELQNSLSSFIQIMTTFVDTYSEMTKEQKERLLELPNNQYTGKEEDSMEKDKKFTQEEMEKAVQEAVTKAIEDASSKVVKLEALSKMSDEVKDYYNSLSDDKKDTFLSKSEKDQVKEMDKAYKDDEVLETEAGVIHKSKVSPEVFALLKSQQEKDAIRDAELKKMKDRMEETELLKKANIDLKYIGNDDDKIKLVKAIQSIPKEDDRKIIMDILTNYNKAIDTGLLETKGGTEDLTKSRNIYGGSTEYEQQLNKMADQHSLDKGISFAKAFVEVKRTKEGRELMRKHREAQASQ